ncbi:hypothetical protein WG936_08085 [Corynebacterium sp. H127]|uniref:hypothetical protein n=1 Tax=Corynebacterium sp. H127 TaxID=3133418 RepID=UPI0030B5A0AC
MPKKTLAPKPGIEPEWSIRDLIGVNLAEAQEGIMGKLEDEYDLESHQIYRIDTFLDEAFHKAANALAEGINTVAFAREKEEVPWA